MLFKKVAAGAGACAAATALTLGVLSAPASAASLSAVVSPDVVSPGVVAPGVVAPSYDDSTYINTTLDHSKCPYNQYAGRLQFIDHGDGAPGGGANDDYFLIEDVCSDGDGVVAYAWQNDTYLGWKYDGNGLEPPIVWDPFFGNDVKPHDKVQMKICSINGINGTPYDCRVKTFTSQDG